MPRPQNTIRSYIVIKILTLLHYSCRNLATTWVSQLPILFVNSTHSVEYIATLNFSKTPLLKVLKIPKVRISTTLNNTLKSNPPP